jgi:pyruvate,orthophosphate dikinase
MIDATITGDFATVMTWADEIRTMGIRANADTPRDAEVAIKFGAQGIGLTRTEHMFFQTERISAVRQMILSQTAEQRQKALDKLLIMQRSDFEGIYRVMREKPVTIRLLDPPLHEFLPNEEEEIKSLAAAMGVEFEALSDTVESLREINPMMGHRGCRLSITNPEITMMQTRAIIEAAINIIKETGVNIVPEIMIPLTCDARELKYVREIVTSTAEEMIAASGLALHYEVGTMIETPRAAVLADTIAMHSDFFSFGTNDLTQMTFGFSRDDAGKFIPSYLTKNVLETDPFEHLDTDGVGKLVKSACESARKANQKLSIGICGEHGGDPLSIEFLNKLNLDYVSCSPYRVPIARLAAAQAALRK